VFFYSAGVSAFISGNEQSGKSRSGAFQMRLSIFYNGEFDMLVDDLASVGPIIIFTHQIAKL